jgi:hypothetical protein
MTVGYLSTTDPRWKALLGEVSHDVYHLPEYLQLSAAYEGGEEHVSAKAFYMQRDTSFCLIPLLVRSLPASLGAPPNWRDVASPYGYAAPLFRGNPSWIDHALTTFAEDCRSRGIVSAFLRLHPLLEVPPVLSQYGDLVKHGETVYVDLSLSESELWSQTRGRLRSYINALQRSGFHSRFEDWSAYDKFVHIYRQTMARLQATDFYRFPVQYFHDLRVALGDKLHLCSVFDAHGDLACGALLTETGGIVQYHLSGSADRFLPFSPSKLMLHDVILWAKRAGHRLLHLGGGLGGQADSLLHFKAGFSPLRSEFLTYRLVFDREKYHHLCQQIEPGTVSNNYFPQYRIIASTVQLNTRTNSD